MNNFETYLNELAQIYEASMPFVVFKKPNKLKLKTYIPKTDELIEITDFEEEGFVFVPFKNGNKIIFPLAKCKVKSQKFEFDEVNINTSKCHIIEKNITEQYLQEKHINLVQNAIDFIKKGMADKIVLSREEHLLVKSFDLFNSFKKMLLKYPNAFVYIWFHPNIGLWMGATPEKLFSISNRTLKTMALAGTQVYKKKLNVNWELKEQKEQQFVTNYIVETIKPFSKEVKITNPFTVRAGNLVHICTSILAELKPKISLKILIDALHPTPAVCGLPKSEATKFILDNENYKRAYYTGFLGELNVNNKTQLFVNLRCMSLKDELISIYVGGGITKDSNAKKEWEETKNKSLVIKNIL